jgi:Tfp pilus assembly protein PilF
VPKLVVFRGDAVESEVPLTGKALRIGRHSTNDIVLDDSANGISRFHAELQCTAGKYFIVDQKSRNGVWVNGKRIKDKTPLAMGVPITIGGFELTLEDDLPSSEIDIPQPPAYPATIAVKPAAPPGKSQRNVAAKSARPRSSTDRRQIIVWTSTVVILLVVSVATYAVVRSMTGSTPEIVREFPTPLPPTRIDLPVPTIPDPQKAFQEQLSRAQDLIEQGDFDGAALMVRSVLESDPDNETARDLKRRIDDARRPTPAVVVAPPPQPVESVAEMPGIPRRAGESAAEYEARVRRIQIAFSDGRASLQSGDFVTAINKFQQAEREQPGYQPPGSPRVDSLIADARTRQKAAVDNAMQGGLANERAGRLRDARLFYLDALRVDPSSSDARAKAAEMKDQSAKQAQDLLVRARTEAKMGERERARKAFEDVLQLMLDGDPERNDALKELEALK